jgi:nitrate reductase NapE component
MQSGDRFRCAFYKTTPSGIITFYLGKISKGGDKMSRTANVILFKFLMTLVFAGIALGFVGGNTFEWVLLVAILGTVIDYLVGDLFILPRVGGLAAAVINGILEALIAFVVAIVVPTFTVTFFPALISLLTDL